MVLKLKIAEKPGHVL